MSITEWISLGKDLLTIGCTSLGTVWLSKYLDKRYRDKKVNLDDDFKKRKQNLPLLEAIRYELDADRVFNMVFTNGDITLTGHHLKKVSVLLEVTGDGVRSLGQAFQLVPTKIFERTLDALYESEDDFVIFNEFDEYDDLAALHSQYNIKTLLKVKIKDQFGRWVGVLNIAFSNQRLLTEGEIAFVKMQAAKLGQLK